jgi:hypothetical protein
MARRAFDTEGENPSQKRLRRCDIIGSGNTRGRRPMNKVTTLAEIKEHFDSEWVLIADPKVDEYCQIVRGKVVSHRKNRDEIDQI